jgi:hypothetical protein
MYFDVFSLTITSDKMKKQNDKQILLSNSKIVERGEIDISNALMACYRNLDKIYMNLTSACGTISNSSPLIYRNEMINIKYHTVGTVQKI